MGEGSGLVGARLTRVLPPSDVVGDSGALETGKELLWFGNVGSPMASARAWNEAAAPAVGDEFWLD